MGNLMEELAKVHLDALDSARKLEKEMAEPGKWEPLAWKTGEKEAHQQVADELNKMYACGVCDECTQGNRCREISEDDWDGAMRARDLSELESIFERLGIDKKLESLKPDLALCKRIIGKDVHYVDERVVFSVKRIIEFIETIDEP